ncbi:ribosomal protein L4 domain-containing protein [Pterulicium gracile]|uniref:Large ribosomal subunit protein uL4m n=1 Tax=Pterulicium gracile TaxID=1884261 RepID=A0A5C3QZI5_9AGAR|nr:ribosomal protein L4 domain-containing protein [Pterula gracilis]
MLAAVRRQLAQGPVFRRLASTVATPDVAPTDQFVAGSSKDSQLTAQTVVKPVYLPLTPPLNPTKKDPKDGDSIVVLDPSVFRHPIRRDILHLCVVHYLDSLRQGSANTKTRSEVRGSGRKLIRQKGTGKARVGDGQSPIRRGGGIAFGPKPRDFSTKLPRKVIEMGMRVALSVKVKEGTLAVTPEISWPNPKARHLSRRIDFLGLRKTLFVTESPQPNFTRAVRNIPMVKQVCVDELNVFELMKWKKVVFSVPAVEYMEALLSKGLPVVAEHVVEEVVAPVEVEAALSVQ